MGCIRTDGGGVCPPRKSAGLCCQLFQNLLPQLLRFAEMFLVLDKDPVQFQGLIRGELAAQHHVADMHRVRENVFFTEFFEGGRGIIVIHADILRRNGGAHGRESGPAPE